MYICVCQRAKKWIIYKAEKIIAVPLYFLIEVTNIFISHLDQEVSYDDLKLFSLISGYFCLFVLNASETTFNYGLSFF